MKYKLLNFIDSEEDSIALGSFVEIGDICILSNCSGCIQTNRLVEQGCLEPVEEEKKLLNPKFRVGSCVVLVTDQCTNYIKIVGMCVTRLGFVYSDILSLEFCENDNVRLATDYKIGTYF